jgi:hypothetical protein
VTGPYDPSVTATPPVPHGPGVQAPFPAPPSEGGGARLGWALGIAGAAIVLCCGGGLLAILGFGITQVAALNEQAHVVVSEYLDDLRDEKYDDAYRLLCDREQAHLTRERFESREKARTRLRDYQVGEFDINSGKLPVTERYRDGSTDVVTYTFESDPKTAQLEICGRE